MTSIALGDVRGAIDALTPSEMYAIADGIARTKDASASPEAIEIAHLKSLVPDQVSEAAISRAWGTPKPTLANSYNQELLNLRTFPTLMGYSSRIMAESWESNLLYWADLGDQLGIQPAQLNVLVPDWTRQVVERIFASHLEDWPALLKSVRSVGRGIAGAKYARGESGAADSGTGEETKHGDAEIRSAVWILRRPLPAESGCLRRTAAPMPRGPRFSSRRSTWLSSVSR